MAVMPSSSAGPFAPTLSFVTLGVAHVGAAQQFYEALGLQPDVRTGPRCAFFQLNGVILALLEHSDLAAQSGGGAVATRAGGRIGAMLSHNVQEDQHIEQILDRVRRGGGTVVGPPEATPWGGRRAWFDDLDGHRWEVVHNPNILRDLQGGVWFRPKDTAPDEAAPDNTAPDNLALVEAFDEDEDTEGRPVSGLHPAGPLTPTQEAEVTEHPGPVPSGRSARRWAVGAVAVGAGVALARWVVQMLLP